MVKFQGFSPKMAKNGQKWTKMDKIAIFLGSTLGSTLLLCKWPRSACRVTYIKIVPNVAKIVVQKNCSFLNVLHNNPAEIVVQKNLN